MDGIVLELRGRDRELKITVSVRAGERLDPPRERLFYHDPLLAHDATFEVNGLTRDELSAEKVLAWCSKPLAKHFVDLDVTPPFPLTQRGRSATRKKRAVVPVA